VQSLSSVSAFGPVPASWSHARIFLLQFTPLFGQSLSLVGSFDSLFAIVGSGFRS
jgi:hypothetical protein